MIVRKKVESKLQEQHQSIDDLGEEEEGEDTNQERQNSLSDEESEGADHSDHEKESENTDKVKVTERVVLWYGANHAEVTSGIGQHAKTIQQC